MAGACHCVLAGPTGQPVDIGQAVAVVMNFTSSSRKWFLRRDEGWFGQSPENEDLRGPGSSPVLRQLPRSPGFYNTLLRWLLNIVEERAAPILAAQDRASPQTYGSSVTHTLLSYIIPVKIA